RSPPRARRDPPASEGRKVRWSSWWNPGRSLRRLRVCRIPSMETLRSVRIVTMSPEPRLGIICIAFVFVPDVREPADFAVINSPNDTDDTKPSFRDTPTIHGIPTMRIAGAFDATFVAKTVP